MRLRRYVSLVSGMMALVADVAGAQWAVPVGAANHVSRDAPSAATMAQGAEEFRPRTRVVVPLTIIGAVAGAGVGYAVGSNVCRRTGGDCWDLLAWIPAGYVAGAAIGGGIAGGIEGCRTAALRSAGGAVLGLIAGAATLLVHDGLGIVTLPAGPIIGATWLVTACRIRPR